MTSYALSRVRNFRRCNAGVPRSLEIEAIIDEITEGWDLTTVCATAARGVAETDQSAIRELIRTEDLRVEPETAIRELRDWCRTYVRCLMKEAETQVRLDELVDAYLEPLGEADRARGESYEETADRLNDDIMRAAAKRWWELEEEPA